MMVKILLAISLVSSSSGATTIMFSGSVNVVAGAPPMSYLLDSSPYMNTVIGQGSWELLSFSSTISNLNINHYIFLFGSGTLDSVKVYGVPQLSGVLTFTANPLTPLQQVFMGAAGTLPNEYVFNLGGYNLGQGGSTAIAGFSSINTINFAGTYTVIPEPSTMLLAGMATMSFLLCRRKE
jgi:PEP-CTERM motif